MTSACIASNSVVDLGVRPDEARHLRSGNRLNGLVVGLAEEEAPTCEHLPKTNAEGEDVGALVGLLPARDFRREVAELALYDAGVRALELRASPFARPKSVTFTSPRLLMRMFGGETSRWTKVQRPTVVVEQLVRVAESAAGLHRDVDRVLQGNGFRFGAASPSPS